MKRQWSQWFFCLALLLTVQMVCQQHETNIMIKPWWENLNYFSHMMHNYKECPLFSDLCVLAHIFSKQKSCFSLKRHYEKPECEAKKRLTFKGSCSLERQHRTDRINGTLIKRHLFEFHCSAENNICKNVFFVCVFNK